MSCIGRTAYRAPSVADIYHVTTRGVAQQIIFEDDDDRLALYRLLSKASRDLDAEIYAWCFMGNHVHLIVHANLADLSGLMRGVLSRYSRWFNERHERSGHLFEERFSSSPINTEEYLVTAVRYVHHNPSGIGVKDIERYPWSSYREYLGKPGLASTGFVLGIFGSVDPFVRFHRLPNDDQVKRASEFESNPGRESSSEDSAIQEAKEILGISNLSLIAQLGKQERDAMLAILKARFGVRRTARLTGISKSVVQRASQSGTLSTGQSVPPCP